MSHLAPTTLLLVMVCCRSVLADGGTVLAAAEQYGYRVTVMGSPTPLRAGPVDISVLIQRCDTGAIVENADVQVVLRPNGADDRGMQSTATREAATNKLFQAAVLTPPNAGSWRLSAIVVANNRQLELETDVDVAEALPQVSDLWLWIGWPAIAIGLFAVHRGFVNRSAGR